MGNKMLSEAVETPRRAEMLLECGREMGKVKLVFQSQTISSNSQEKKETKKTKNQPLFLVRICS